MNMQNKAFVLYDTFELYQNNYIRIYPFLLIIRINFIYGNTKD